MRTVAPANALFVFASPLAFCCLLSPPLSLLQLQLSLCLGFELAAAELDEELLRPLGLGFELLVQCFDALELECNFEGCCGRRGGCKTGGRGECCRLKSHWE